MFSSKSTFASLAIVLSLSAGLLAQSGEPPNTARGTAEPVGGRAAGWLGGRAGICH